MTYTKTTILAVIAGLSLSASAADAAQLRYFAELNDLNGIGASGRVDLSLDTEAKRLKVHVQARGLAPDVTHVQHIHGVKNPDGSNGNSVSPTLAEDDADGDGFLELLEGAPKYGPVILSLTDDTRAGLAGFPTAPGGVIDFAFEYDLLTTSAFSGDFGIDDLLDLENREIVIHGAFTDFLLEDNLGGGLGGGIQDDGMGNPIAAPRNYNAGLPVLAGEISAVPLPAAGWLLMMGVAGLGLMRRKTG